MRALPDDFDVQTLTASLLDGWGVAVEAIEYAPVGGGSYHWVATGRDGTRHFVTVDDLGVKPWLGSTPDEVFAGLCEAFDASADLREGGLEFVIAPIRTTDGETVLRSGPRYAIALFPFMTGQAGTFGEYDDAERAAILAMLPRLHRTSAAVRPFDLELPGRQQLDAALGELGETWNGGPLSEPTRAVFVKNASAAERLLARYDRLVSALPGRTDWVVTHGEPHAGNVIRTGGSYVLVDWDTVALAPVERDLWMLTDDGSDAVAFFRLRWDLADLTAYTALLRSPHTENADTLRALQGVTVVLGR